jgi:hypothetical protein
MAAMKMSIVRRKIPAVGSTIGGAIQKISKPGKNDPAAFNLVGRPINRS